MYVIKKKSLVVSAVLLCLTVVTWVCIACVSAPISGDGRVCVVIDAGHGGIDVGAVGSFTSVHESNINLEISKMVRDRFLAADINVVMTRENSDGLYGLPTAGFKRRDMQKRKQIIENAQPNMVLSIHMNKTDLQSCSGAQVFYHKTSENGKNLAQSIQDSLNKNIEFKRPRNITTGDFYMLNSTPYTAVLIECGFLSNREEEKLLSTKAYQEKIAQYIYEGAIKYLTTDY